MAVSGRKAADVRGSISRGSTEDFEHCCEPCLTECQHIVAFRYCVDCQEYLCKNCVRYHQKTKVLKHHQLKENYQADKHTPETGSTETCTEKCYTHRNKVIKFYCPEHEALGCSDCMIMGHRTCHIDYILNKCKDLGNSEEYKEAMKTLDEKLNHLDYIVKKVTAKDKELDISHDKVIQEISQFREVINDHLDRLQKKIEIDINKRRSEDKQKVQNVFASCTKLSSKIKQLQTNLQSSLLAKEYGKLFIALKQAMQSDDAEEAEINSEMSKLFIAANNASKQFKDLEETVMLLEEETQIKKHCFVPNESLINVMENVDELGELFVQDIESPQEPSNSLCNSYFDYGFFTMIPLSKPNMAVVLAHVHNFILVVDQNKIIQKKMTSGPWDMATVGENRFAVTMPDEKKIKIFYVSDNLLDDNSVSAKQDIIIDFHCEGIACAENDMFVTCSKPPQVIRLEMNGNVKQIISSDKSGVALFKQPAYITYNVETDSLFIYGRQASSITTMTTDGEVREKHRYKLKMPIGLVEKNMLSAGGLFLTGRD